MNEPFIIDAHLHVGSAGQLSVADPTVGHIVALMDRLGIARAIGSDHTALLEGGGTGLARMMRAFEESQGRVHGLAVVDPRAASKCLGELERSLDWKGLAGIKIHPSCHQTPADDPSYGPVWQFASSHDLTILAHSWSVSDYNPSQALSVPGRFERWVREFPTVRLVLGHAGGRGSGRPEAIRLANECANVYLDFAGDIYCYRLIETLVQAVASTKILFGSDFPWTGPSDHLSRVLLADVGDGDKARILRLNAMNAYQVKMEPC